MFLIFVTGLNVKYGKFKFEYIWQFIQVVFNIFKCTTNIVNVCFFLYRNCNIIFFCFILPPGNASFDTVISIDIENMLG